jgi:epoxide hydrolase-like predicted phosphatase
LKATIKKNTKIKAIIWDNWGVLVNAKCGSIAHLWSERLGAPIENVIRVFTGPQLDQWHLGNMDKNEFLDYVIRDLGLPAEKREYLENESTDEYTFDEELLVYIKSTKGKYIIAMLTNIPRSSYEKGRDAWPELFESFDHVIPSFEVNLIKPDPRIYQLTLERIGCQAEEAVFIDDTKEFIQGAQKLGIRSILFKNREQAIEELESILTNNS